MSSKIEQSGFVATPEDVQEITRDALDASAKASGGKATYLKALVGTTQGELGGPQGRRRANLPPLSLEERKRQLEALEAVHARFYEAVMKTVQAVPIMEEERGRVKEQVWSSRANFARSAKSVLRSWISVEGNIMSLNPSKVTKYGLQAATPKRTGPPIRAPSERRLIKMADGILERVKSAGKQEDAIRILENVISRLVNGLAELGVKSTARMTETARDHKPADTKDGIFWSVNPSKQVGSATA